MDIEDPFPIEGTIRYTEQTIGGPTVSCGTEWLTEHETGNLLKQARREIMDDYEPPVEVDIIFRVNGNYEILDTTEIDDE